MKITYKIAAVALMLGFAVQANAQDNSTTASATATVISPITLSKTADMAFGSVAGDATLASTVILASDGTTTTTSGAQTVGSTAAAAAFTVTGDDLAYTISLPTTPVTLTEPTTSTTMTLTNFTDSEAGSGSIALGTDSFTVGATLNIGAAQAEETYTGTFTVSVDYN